MAHGAPRGNRNGGGYGAPRGNRNALKYGVYTRKFTRPFAPPPGMSLVEVLELEIHRIRLYIRDDLVSTSLDRSDIGSHLALLCAVTIAVGCIERLHRRIFALQASHAFESDFGRSITRELSLFPAVARDLVPSSACRSRHL